MDTHHPFKTNIQPSSWQQITQCAIVFSYKQIYFIICVIFWNKFIKQTNLQHEHKFLFIDQITMFIFTNIQSGSLSVNKHNICLKNILWCCMDVWITWTESRFPNNIIL